MPWALLPLAWPATAPAKLSKPPVQLDPAESAGLPADAASSVHTIAAASALAWATVSLLAHACSLHASGRYRAMARRERLQWCNRLTSALHALVLVGGQAPNLWDARLLAEPLHATTEAHFLWGSVFYGYLLYDTAYSLAFWADVGSPAFLLHHGLGFACCALGLRARKMAVFGMFTQVVLESTTPLLHLLGCLRALGLQASRAYRLCGLGFVAQFFLCRVVAQNAVVAWLVHTVRRDAPDQAWAWAGVSLLLALSGLNLFWFLKLLALARALPPGRSAERCLPAAAPAAADQPAGPFSAAWQADGEDGGDLPVSTKAVGPRATAGSTSSRPGTRDILVDCRASFGRAVLPLSGEPLASLEERKPPDGRQEANVLRMLLPRQGLLQATRGALKRWRGRQS